MQPTRLLRPWDSPGKNTGVGCHFLLQCMKVESESEVAQSCPTLSNPMDCSPPGSSIHGILWATALEWGAIAFSNLRGAELLDCRVYASLTLLHIPNCSLVWLCQFKLFQQHVEVPIFQQTQIWLQNFCLYNESKMVSPFDFDLHFPDYWQGWTCLHVYRSFVFALPWIVWRMWNNIGDSPHAHRTCRMWKHNWTSLGHGGWLSRPVFNLSKLEPSRLLSMGSHRVGHDCSDLAAASEIYMRN